MPTNETENTPIVMEKRPRFSGLHDLEDVKRNMARACRAIERGKIETDRGRTWVYALRCLSQLMQEMDTERRLADLEEELAKLKMAKLKPVREKVLEPA
jgi:hypothetical protein